MQCQKCGTELKEGAKFCNKCGHNVSLPFIEEEPFFSKLLKTIIQNIQNTNTKVWYKRWWVWSAAAVVGIMLAITIIIKMTELVEMVEIPAGTFAMGSPGIEANRSSDEVQYQVTLSAFMMGKYQITQSQYEKVMGTNPSSFNSNPADREVQFKRPVEQVSWYDALVFCNKLSIMEGRSPAYSINGSTNPADWGTIPSSSNAIWNAVEIVDGSTGYRLPTEAQWEYACRSGTTTAYHTGNTIDTNTGWYKDNSNGRTHEVGQKPANTWGLYDMHGNVYDWCWDWYGRYNTEPQTDPAGPVFGSDRVVRGGSWGLNASRLRSAYRDYATPSNRYDRVGFRVVRPKDKGGDQKSVASSSKTSDIGLATQTSLSGTYISSKELVAGNPGSIGEITFSGNNFSHRDRDGWQYASFDGTYKVSGNKVTLTFLEEGEIEHTSVWTIIDSKTLMNHSGVRYINASQN